MHSKTILLCVVTMVATTRAASNPLPDKVPLDRSVAQRLVKDDIIQLGKFFYRVDCALSGSNVILQKIEPVVCDVRNADGFAMSITLNVSYLHGGHSALKNHVRHDAPARKRFKLGKSEQSWRDPYGERTGYSLIPTSSRRRRLG